MIRNMKHVLMEFEKCWRELSVSILSLVRVPEIHSVNFPLDYCIMKEVVGSSQI